jgi:hypothetical protein
MYLFLWVTSKVRDEIKEHCFLSYWTSFYHGNASLLAKSLEVIQLTASIILAAPEPAAERDEVAKKATEQKRNSRKWPNADHPRNA